MADRLSDDSIRLRVQPIVVVVAGIAAVAIGAAVLSVQDLYITTGSSYGVDERSFNWWGLGIGVGLVTGGLGGLVGVARRNSLVLNASGLLICLSAMWHPLLWVALLASVPYFLLAFVIDRKRFDAPRRRGPTALV